MKDEEFLLRESFFPHFMDVLLPLSQSLFIFHSHLASKARESLWRQNAEVMLPWV